MKQHSNHTAKFLEYEFEIFVGQVFLKTNFSCHLYTSLKYQYDLPQLISPQVMLQDSVAQIKHIHKFSMLLKCKGSMVDSQDITLQVGIRSKHRPLEKIIAGYVKFNISNYTNSYQPLKIFKIQRCPNNDGRIEISIKSRKIKQLCLSNINPKLFKSKSIQHKTSVQTIHLKQKQQFKEQVALNNSFKKNQQGSIKRISNIPNQQLKTRKLIKTRQSVSSDQQSQLCLQNLKQQSILHQKVDNIKKSVELFSKQSSSNIQTKDDILKINQQLKNKFQKSEQQRKQQQIMIMLLKDQLKNVKQKIQTQKSMILLQTTSRTILDKQLTSIYSGSTIYSQKSHKISQGQMDLIQRNKQLLKTLAQFRQNITPSLQQLQIILQQQTKQYWQQSSWKGLQILSSLVEKINIQ